MKTETDPATREWYKSWLEEQGRRKPDPFVPKQDKMYPKVSNEEQQENQKWIKKMVRLHDECEATCERHYTNQYYDKCFNECVQSQSTLKDQLKAVNVTLGARKAYLDSIVNPDTIEEIGVSILGEDYRGRVNRK